MGDSIQGPQRINLPNKNIFAVIFKNDVTGCDYDSKEEDTTTITGGYFHIKKLDKANGIMAGEFEFVIKKTGCEEVKITKGRFDLKY